VQLTAENVNNIALTANIIFVLSEILMLVYIAKWAVTSNTKEINAILTAWALVSAGYLLRIGYWAVAIMYSPGNKVYPQWALDHRWVTVVFAFMVMYGNLIFIRSIEKFPTWAKWLYMSIIVVCSLLFVSVS